MQYTSPSPPPTAIEIPQLDLSAAVRYEDAPSYSVAPAETVQNTEGYEAGQYAAETYETQPEGYEAGQYAAETYETEYQSDQHLNGYDGDEEGVEFPVESEFGGGGYYATTADANAAVDYPVESDYQNS